MNDKLSKENVEIFVQYPHGNRDLILRLEDLKKDIKNNRHPLLKEGLEFTKNLKLKNKFILDAGCGSGDKTIVLGANSDAHLVLGVDGSGEAINNANLFLEKLSIKNVNFVNGLLEDLEILINNYKKQKVDIIVNYQMRLMLHQELSEKLIDSLQTH